MISFTEITTIEREKSKNEKFKNTWGIIYKSYFYKRNSANQNNVK